MKGKKAYVLMACLFVLSVSLVPDYRSAALYVDGKSTHDTVVIDPGHGGMDGGAQSADGTSEKEINLIIAKELKERLENSGISAIMTRDDDNGLYDKSQEEDASVRSLKTQDMRKRKDVIDNSGAKLAVSIHLNSFTGDSSVSGAQVFYPLCEGETNSNIADSSKEAAAIIQSKLNEEINESKKRTELGKNDVFILKDVVCPTVIAECGFLSNPGDVADLKKSDFQKKIADVLCRSICDYLNR